MRPFRFAIHLREAGWEPVVLTIATPNQHLTEKEASLLEGVRIIEIASPLDRTARSESQLGLEQKRPTPLSRALRGIDRQFPVDTWLLLFLLRYREMLRTVEAVQPEVIWTTGDPWSALVVTSRLATRAGIPWVADFRDPWTLSELPRHQRRPLARPIDRFCERRVLESAEVVIFQTRSVEAAYHAHYAALDFDSCTITNSYDEALFGGGFSSSKATASAVSPGQELIVAFFGRFREASPATILIDALAEVRRRSPTLAARIKIYSFGPLNAADADYAEQQGVLGCFREHAVVPLEDALQVLKTFDILVVSTELRREKIIPAKLFEYLPAGRPILSLSMNEEIEEILGTTGTGIQVNPHDPAGIADRLIACLKARDAGDPLPLRFHPDAVQIGRYEAKRTTAELAEVFNLLADRPRKRH